MTVFLPTARISPVTTGVSIGGLSAYKETDALRTFGFILNVAAELADGGAPTEYFPPTGQTIYNGHLRDAHGQQHHAQIPEVLRCVRLLAAARAEGKRALVTCAMGLNRSALVIAEYLICYGMDPAAAVQLLKTARRGALSNEDFVAWLGRKR